MDFLTIIQKLLPVIILAIAFLVLLSLFGFYNAVRPHRIISSVTPDDFGLNFEEITLKTSDNLQLSGWFIPNKNTDKTVILLHGYPADKGNILPSLAFLAQHYNLLLFDFRYLGQSEGKYSTAGANETKDLAAAIEWLKHRGINNIGIWGFSLGGAVALMTANQHPEVKAVVSESSYANLNLMASSLYRLPSLNQPLAWLTRMWGILLLRIDIINISPAKHAQNLRLPILIIHSRNDKIIPFSHALQIQNALRHNSKAQFWFENDLTHGQLNKNYQQKITKFFQRHL